MKKILTIQDFSCVGKCSLTVAIPIISAFGIEACALPTALLSTHTQFKNWTFKNLCSEIDPITDAWEKENIIFDGICTGYLGGVDLIESVKDIIKRFVSKDGVVLIDPAMGDNGKLYAGFDMEYVKATKTLCAMADVITPNITEACFMTSTEYKTEYDQEYILNLLQKLSPDGKVTVVLTGVSYTPDTTGVVVYENRTYRYYEHKKISKGCHGTGDVYASAFTGALLNGHSTYEAAKIAADYVVSCIEYTQKDPTHWYGVKFEAKLAELIQSL